MGGAFLIAAMFSGVAWKMVVDSVLGTVKITSMIMLLVIVLLYIVLLYIVLGFFIEALSLMVVTIPIVVPIILDLGYDPIWFGILMIVLIEMALITPPVGLNLHVVQGTGHGGSMSEVTLGAIPLRTRHADHGCRPHRRFRSGIIPTAQFELKRTPVLILSDYRSVNLTGQALDTMKLKYVL